MKDFKGRVAVITGAANGFGREYVKEAAKRGMKILAVDIEGDEVQLVGPLAQELGAEEIVCLQADVSLFEDTQKVVKTAMEKWGQIDLLINNAGTGKGGTISNLPLRDWEWMMYANVFSHIYMMKQVIPIMMKQGTHCNIVNTCSAAGTFTSKSAAAYQASKFGALALTESVYYDLADAGADIHMSAYCPGFIQTHLDHSEEYKQDKYKIEDPYYGSKYHQRYGETCPSSMGSRPLCSLYNCLYKSIV